MATPSAMVTLIEAAIEDYYTNARMVVDYSTPGGVRVRKSLEDARADLKYWRGRAAASQTGGNRSYVRLG